MSAESTEAIWQHLFALFDRDHSGLLDEADVAAAIRSTGTSEDLTRRALAGVSAGGRVEPARFRELLEQHIDAAIGRGADAAAGRPKGARVRYYLGVLRDFERRATARGEFMIAAEARHYAKGVRQSEEVRQKEVMAGRLSRERDGVQEAHVLEAVEFNRAWTTNMEEFEARARGLLDDLRVRHEAALAEFIERCRAEQPKAGRHSKAMLELLQVQDKLARSGNYVEAQKCQRKMRALARQEAASVAEVAEETVRRKIEAFKSAQKLEAEALSARIDRGRSEHRNHWAQGAARLMQSHKNMLTDLSLRQNVRPA